MSLTVPAPESVDRAVLDLEELGFASRFRLADDGLLCCRTCGVCHDPADLAVAEPGRRATDDGQVVLPVVCPCCRERGTAILPGSPAA